VFYAIASKAITLAIFALPDTNRFTHDLLEKTCACRLAQTRYHQTVQVQSDESRLTLQATLLNAVHQAVIATDAAGCVTFWNHHAEALYGWAAGEAIGRNIVEVLVSPEQTKRAGEIMAAVSRGKMWQGEFEIQRRDGTRFFAEVIDSPVVDESGNIIGIIGISHDISERRRLQQNERMLADIGALLAESITTTERVSRLATLLVRSFADICIILLVDDAGAPIHFQAALRDPAKEPLLTALAQYPPMTNPTTATARALHTGESVFFPIVPEEYKQATAVDAHHNELREQLGFHSMITLPLIARDNTLGVMTVARSAELPEYHPQDFTFMQEINRSAALFLDNTRLLEGVQATNAELEQRVQARTTELRESQSQLRLLTARLHATREDERRRIAREVHDVIGQLLTSLKMEAGRLDLKLNEAGSPLTTHTRSMIDMLDSAFNSVRQIATDLRPTLLDDLGLIAAMEWQVGDFQAHSGITSRFDSTLESAPIGSDAMIAVFRVLQEALTNVARHAGATRVDVTVEEDHRGRLVLRIHDNGRGINADELQHSQSLGLMGMRERIQLLGGEFAIAGAPAKGTLLTICVPMNNADADMREITK
jgi:PAS domain S-box-containing protein